jgi:hypothetical protein
MNQEQISAEFTRRTEAVMNRMVAAVDAEDDPLICTQAAILAAVSVGRRICPPIAIQRCATGYLSHLGTSGKGCGRSMLLTHLKGVNPNEG